MPSSQSASTVIQATAQQIAEDLAAQQEAAEAKAAKDLAAQKEAVETAMTVKKDADDTLIYYCPSNLVSCADEAVYWYGQPSSGALLRLANRRKNETPLAHETYAEKIVEHLLGLATTLESAVSK